MRLPSASAYAFWLSVVRIATGVLWLLHGIPKFTRSAAFMPPNGAIVGVVNNAIRHTSDPYHQFLVHTVLPNLYVFAELERLGEVIVGALLVFGLFTRLGALIGVAMALNYLAARGTLTHPSAWSGIEGVTVLLCALNVVLPTGRMLGVDALLGPRRAPDTSAKAAGARVQPEFVDEQPMTGPSAPKE